MGDATGTASLPGTRWTRLQKAEAGETEAVILTDYPGLLLLNKAFGCLKPSLSDLNTKIIQHQVGGGPTPKHLKGLDTLIYF